MMKTIFVALATASLLNLSPAALAQEASREAGSETASSVPAGTILTARVNGMVCDFCARAVQKVFRKEPGVESVHVDLDTGAIIVGLEAGAEITDERVAELVRKSGYAFVSLSRSDA